MEGVRRYKGKHIDGDGNVYEGDFIEIDLNKGKLEDLIEKAIELSEQGDIDALKEEIE